MTWTNPDDVIDRWIGDEVPATIEQLQTLIGDAEDMIHVAAPELAAVVGSKIPISRAVRVVSGMVLRVLRNPDGIRQRSHTAGPFTEQIMFGGDEPGQLVFTTADRQALAGTLTTGSRRRAFTVYPAGM